MTAVTNLRRLSIACTVLSPIRMCSFVASAGTPYVSVRNVAVTLWKQLNPSILAGLGPTPAGWAERGGASARAVGDVCSHEAGDGATGCRADLELPHKTICVPFWF